MRIIKSIINIVSVMAVIVMMGSCKPGVPDDYIQPGKMEDILYDYHIAMAMADEGDPSQRDQRIVEYKEAVLKKYGCTDKQFETSMEYYMRHTERLHDIYENLADRLNDEAKDLGAEGSAAKATYAANGDTANVWKGPQSLVLMPKPGFNSYSFTVKVDTAFHAGDKLQLQFNSSYIIQDGTRNAVAVMAVTLSNDSIVTQTMRISSDSRMTSVYAGAPDMKIKAIRGFILFLPDNGVIPTTTLKILCLTDIQLLRIHAPKPGSTPAGAMPAGPMPPTGGAPQPTGGSSQPTIQAQPAAGLPAPGQPMPAAAATPSSQPAPKPRPAMRPVK